MVIDYESISDCLLARKLNWFDLLIHDAVWTLYVNGVTVFTISTVIKVISGNPEINPSKIMEEKIRDSLSRLLTTSVIIAFTEEYKLYQKEDGSPQRRTIYEGQLISGEMITEKINNQYSNAAVRIFREPILGELASMKNQVTTISNLYLDVPVRLDIETYVLRNYLLRRIRLQNRGKEKNAKRIILMDTLWNTMCVRNNEYKKKKRIQHKTEKMLSHWKKVGFITDYQINKSKITLRV